MTNPRATHTAGTTPSCSCSPSTRGAPRASSTPGQHFSGRTARHAVVSPHPRERPLLAPGRHKAVTVPEGSLRRVCVCPKEVLTARYQLPCALQGWPVPTASQACRRRSWSAALATPRVSTFIHGNARSTCWPAASFWLQALPGERLARTFSPSVYAFLLL